MWICLDGSFKRKNFNELSAFFECHKIKSKLYLVDNITKDNVKKAKVVLELNRTGQRGLTMRAMEALAMGKKLITNNTYILESNFYNSNNIFVLGLDPLVRLKEFVESAYEDASEDVINLYDVNHWIRMIST